MPRLFVDEPLAEGWEIGLAENQAHYLLRVMRLGLGDEILLFNGRDGEWLAGISGTGKDWCSAKVGKLRRPREISPDLWLVFAPIKKPRLGMLVEKATELGASLLWPVLTRRSQNAGLNLGKLRAHAVEAAEQCERLDVPECREATDLPRLLAEWPCNRRLLVCAEAGPATPITEALAACKGQNPPPALLVGPEGGFAPEELEMLRAHPQATAVCMGPRILRAETAAIAACTLWQAFVGDASAPNRPPFRS